VAALAALVPTAVAQQPQARFGGSYETLGPRRQVLVDLWVSRFAEVTGQKLAAGPFYDEILSLSDKTTFDAVTHALMTTTLTDEAGAALGDALALVERVESVRGEVQGARGDGQFRIYVRMTATALDTLSRSREFHRGADNSVYHKGYPLNFRQQGGVPSIQVSMAVDGRRADIDVDYRSASIPASLFNGHLSSSNSDVRAGNNSDKHNGRWVGLQNWWGGLFGNRTDYSREPSERAIQLPKTPRNGKQPIEAMANDFLTAWLVDGDQLAALSYVSERAYACLAQDRDDPSDFDRGMAPFQLMVNLKAAHDALGPRSSLEGVTVGIRPPSPALRPVNQPHHARFVVFETPDDVAANFDCGNRLIPGEAAKAKRVYGNYYGTTFYVQGKKDRTVALLWAKENDYWKIVSWRTGEDVTSRAEAAAPPPPPVSIATVKADDAVVQASHGFLESWLVRRKYDDAMAFLSPKSYGCYDLTRAAGQPAATSPADAAAKIRAALERTAEGVTTGRTLETIVEGPTPTHPATKLAAHRYAKAFTLTSVPNAMAEAAGCDRRAGNSRFPSSYPPEYGDAYAMSVRFRTVAGEAPVLRTLWMKQDGAWRITAYDVELP
jgi:hypothetical protein